MANNIQIYDIRRFVCKDSYCDILMFGVIHIKLSLRQEDTSINNYYL